MRARHYLLWLLAGVVGAFALAWSFPRLYPLFPRNWEVSKAEAEAIALERLRDLGEPPTDGYIVTRLVTESVRELRVQELLDTIEQERIRRSRLARDLLAWETTVFAPGAAAGDWRQRARLTLDGEVTALQMRPAPAEELGEAPGSTEARAAAEVFLRQEGLDPGGFDEPEIRRRQLENRTDVALRYRDREALFGEDVRYGVEVTFTGDRLAGFSPYFDDPRSEEVQGEFQLLILLNQLWIFMPLPLLPLVAIPFLRRYHAGEIGVSRGLRILALVLGCGVVIMLFCAPEASAGFSIGFLTRRQVTWVVGFQMVLLYFFPMALLAFLSWSVGESLCRERWARKLAAFDAFFKGHWMNATVARAALRGSVAGILIPAGLWALALPLARLGARPVLSSLFGPWWESTSWLAVPLVLSVVAVGLYQELVGRLLLTSVGVSYLGRWLGGGLAALAGGLLFFPPVIVLPLPWGLPLWFLASAAVVVLFVRYGIFTALLATVVANALSGTVPFLTAVDRGLQLQALVALLVVAAPLIVSLRYLTSGREFTYSYDDVPPHVRRIAERERQRVELETARGIQSSILPRLPSRLNGVEIAHTYLPATEVGGDFYDVLALEDGRLAVAVGDVAGHGVSSGLVMSMAKSALAVQVTFDPEVEAVFATLNRLVYQSARKRLLTTLCYALIDPGKPDTLYASAGHLFPYRVGTDGRVQALESVAYPLGVRAHLEVRVSRSALTSGDSLVFFSDGVVEARPEGSEELWGFDRLEESLRRHAGNGPEVLRDGILADLRRFTGEHPREDDLTLLVLRLP